MLRSPLHSYSSLLIKTWPNPVSSPQCKEKTHAVQYEKGEALHTVNNQPIAVNTGNGQNRGLYLPSGQNYPQDVKEIPVSRNVRPTLRWSYQYGREGTFATLS